MVKTTTFSKYSIRRLEPADLAQVYAISEYHQLQWSLSTLESVQNSRHHENFGVFAEQELLGFILSQILPPVCTVELIAVKSGQRWKGIGKELLNFIEKKCQPACTEMDLEVSATNPATEFYEALNFHAYHVRKKYYPDGSDAVLMKKLLIQG